MRTSSPGSDDKGSPSAEKLEEILTKVKDESREATEVSTKSNEKAVDETIAPPGAVPDPAADAGSKKRAREDDDGAEEQGSSKRVESKVES